MRETCSSKGSILNGANFTLVTALILFSFSQNQLQADDASSSKAVIEKIAKVFDTHRKSVRSLRVELDYDIKHDALAKENNYDRSSTIHASMTFAFKDENRYLKLKSFGLSQDGSSIQTERLAIYNSKAAVCYLIEPKSAVIQKDKSSYTELNYYTPHLAWVVTGQDEEFAETSATTNGYLPNTLSNPDWRVSEEQPEIQGTRCLVLENTTISDKLFLDPKRNYAIIRRERRFDLGSPLTNIGQYSNFELVAPDFWLPKQLDFEVKFFSKDFKTPTGESKSTVAVKSVTINDVNDKLFQIPDLAPGTIVADRIENITYVADKGGDVLENSIRNSIREVQIAKTAPRDYLLPLILLQVAVAFGIASVTLIRRIRLRMPRT